MKNTKLKRGCHERFFTPMGGLSMAVRRTAANMTATSMSIALQTDVSHTTATKYEVKLWAGLISYSRMFHTSHQLDLQAGVDSADPRAVRFQLHMMRGGLSYAVRPLF